MKLLKNSQNTNKGSYNTVFVPDPLSMKRMIIKI